MSLPDPEPCGIPGDGAKGGGIPGPPTPPQVRRAKDHLLLKTKQDIANDKHLRIKKRITLNGI